VGDVWVGRFLQIFGPALAAWSAFLAFVVHLKKLRNAEKAAEHSRVMDELDRVYEALKVAREECDMARDNRAECEARGLEWQSRAVTAEATLLGLGIGRQGAATIVAVERLSKPEAHRNDGE
jgi:hypothetical protein